LIDDWEVFVPLGSEHQQEECTGFAVYEDETLDERCSDGFDVQIHEVMIWTEDDYGCLNIKEYNIG
jgi:hypothetical protein